MSINDNWYLFIYIRKDADFGFSIMDNVFCRMSKNKHYLLINFKYL